MFENPKIDNSSLICMSTRKINFWKSLNQIMNRELPPSHSEIIILHYVQHWDDSFNFYILVLHIFDNVGNAI